MGSSYLILEVCFGTILHPPASQSILLITRTVPLLSGEEEKREDISYHHKMPGVLHRKGMYSKHGETVLGIGALCGRLESIEI